MSERPVNDDEHSPKSSRHTLPLEETLKIIIERSFPEFISQNAWLMSERYPLENSLLYANGRFQGLVPGLSDLEGYGGHPGLIFKLIVFALMLGITHIGISISIKVDTTTNPLPFDQKERLISIIIGHIKSQLPDILLQNARASGIDTDSDFMPFLQRKLSELQIHTVPLSNPIKNVTDLIDSLFVPPHIDNLVMVTGLETKKSTNEEYNKYAKIFESLITARKVVHVKFIITSRKGRDNISGTKIRELILDRDYEEIARLLLNADFSADEFLLAYGRHIRNIKEGLEEEPSQEAEGYAETLQSHMIELAMNSLARIEELKMLSERTVEEDAELSTLLSVEEKLRRLITPIGSSGAKAAADELGGGGGKKTRRRRPHRIISRKRRKRSKRNRKYSKRR